MSLEIVLQNNQSERYHVNKRLSTVATYNGTLKHPVDTMNPVILIKAKINSIIGVNYLTVPALSRSYFVSPPVVATSNLIELHCHEDVLTTYREQLKQTRAIVMRQQNTYNCYFDDSVFHSYQKSKVKKFVFGMDSSGNITEKFPDPLYLLTIAGS